MHAMTRSWWLLMVAACGGKSAAPVATPDPPDPICGVLDKVIAAAPGGFASLRKGDQVYGPDDRTNELDTSATPIEWRSWAGAESSLPGELMGTVQRVGGCPTLQGWQGRPTHDLLALDQVGPNGTEIQVQGLEGMDDGNQEIVITVIAPQ